MVKNSRKWVAGTLVLCMTFFSQGVYALPQDGTVVGGHADPFEYSTDTLTITQNSDRLVTDWDSFSISQPESVIFQQPSMSSIALNRVTGTDPSLLLGKLSANGRVFLTNPNGIIFGVNAVVDTAGLLASTLSLDMSVEDFLAGGDQFLFSGPGGSIVNYGNISLNGPGGYVALLGSSVKNAGLIEANLGKVILAGGECMTLDLDPEGLISVAVNIHEGTERNDRDEYAAVNNVGTIKADGGKVVLTADILGDVFTSAVNNDGIIEAYGVSETDGVVLLRSNQNIELNGRIDASGAIDAYAQKNIILGRPIEDFLLSTFSWNYLSDNRSYTFKEFGYYYGAGDVLVMLSRGYDIGKDPSSPKSGSGFQELPGEPLGLYAIFDTTGIDDMGLITYYENPALNIDGRDHLLIEGTVYGWEDMYQLGDQDFDDAVMDFVEDFTKVESVGASLSSPNIFLTSREGGIEQQSGVIIADNLVLSANTGITGPGANGGFQTKVEKISAVNHSSGDIRIENEGPLVVADLRSLEGLNPSMCVFNGIVNHAAGGEVNLSVKGEEKADLTVDAPVESSGPVIFAADGSIMQTASGDVLIHNAYVPPGPPKNLQSSSHDVGIPSDDRKVDITWELPDSIPGYGFSGSAGEDYVMTAGSEIRTQGGNASITAQGDVSLALVDSQNGHVDITSEGGSILDADLGSVPGDYDIIAHNIQLSAIEGQMGGSGAGEEIDLGHPYDFSYIWDHSSDSAPDVAEDSYEAFFDATSGDWSFASVSGALADEDWWVHVATLDTAREPTVFSDPAHLGPFKLTTFQPPAPPPPGPTPVLFSQVGSFLEKENIEHELRVYYEILEPSQFLGFEPATPIGLYAYHPLTPTDSSAFDDIKLDAGAYDFIDDNIRMKKAVSPYFGL